MRVWTPPPGIGRLIAIVLLLATIGGLGLVVWQLRQTFSGDPTQWQIGPDLFIRVCLLCALALCAGWLAYRLAAALTLRYELDRNALTIIWLGSRMTIPLDQIVTVDAGVRAATRLGPLQQIGAYWGRGVAPGHVPVHFFTTRSPASSLTIYAAGVGYLISPSDQAGFISDLDERRKLGAARAVTATTSADRLFLSAFWNDPAVRWLLALVLMVNLAALGLLTLRYGALPQTLEMRFDSAGGVSGMRPRFQILFLPLAAFGLSLVNLLIGLVIFRREPDGARLVQGASLLIQLLFAVAVLSVMR